MTSGPGLHLPSEAAEPDVADVAQAIRAGHVTPWYQPIVDLSTDKIVGLEAFARRHYPDGRIEAADAFVPIAERSDLIVDLDLAVAGQALTTSSVGRETIRPSG